MGYLSCRAESSISTCRSIAAVSASQTNNKKKQSFNSKDEEEADDREKQQQHGGGGDEDSNSDRFRRHIEHFTYAELESATSNFSDSSLLGRGSHGSVYRATLPRPHHHRRASVVAVKRPSPRPALPPSRNEVENEIEILSKIHSHRLVNLIGFTPLPNSSSSSSKSKQEQRQQRLLVMEFMPNGTLYDFLHTNPRLPSWPRRLRLALQTAKALLTLHSARPPLIHRDVKSANILIDHNFNARLGDFGLALRLDDTDPAFPSSCRSTPPAGTLGYLDPCYVTPDNLSTKTDVFSFGILLLEIVSGRKAIDVAHSPPSVVEWAVPLLRKGKVGAIYDPRISPPKDSRVRRQLALLAASCVRSSDERRPTMEEVVEQLKALSKAVNAAAKAWNGLSVVNPCSAVETERTLSKVSSDAVKSGKDSNGATNAKLGKETGRREGEEEEVPAGIKKPPLPVSVTSSAKATRPLRNGNKVFLDEEAKKGGRNLMELLARPDGEIIDLCGGRSSVISNAKTLQVTTDYYGRGGMVRLQRNQTVKGIQFESLVISDGFQNSDKRIRGQARYVT